MGNCNSTFDCTACFDGHCDENINVDADIVGPGVLASFFLSALITIASIIYGYLSDCLPKWYLSEVDEAILARYRASWYSTKCVSSLKNIWYWIIHHIRGIFCQQSHVYSAPIDSERRVEALARFILALSDQQLVTGLAILVGALGSRCTLSAYEFNVVVSLAWFSSTTHLATLDVLRDYFIQHQVVRNIRVFGMVSILGLLMFGLIVEGGSNLSDWSMPFTCSITALSEGINSSGLISPVFTILVLLQFYTNRIGQLFNGHNDVDRSLYPNQERVLRILISACHPNLDIERTEYRRIIKEVVSETQHEHRETTQTTLRKLYKRRAMKPIAICVSMMYRFSDSFLANIPTLFFGLSYGVSQVVLTRWYSSPEKIGNVNNMSFGQIVPLFLLVLPALAAAEIYYDARKSSNIDPSLRSTIEHPHVYLEANSSVNTGKGIPSPLTSGPNLPHPIHERNTRGLIDEFYGLEQSSVEAKSLSTKTSSTSHNIWSSARNDSQPPKSLSSHQPLDISDSPESTKFIMLIFIFFCLSSVAVGIMLNVVDFSTTIFVVVFILVLYLVLMGYSTLGMAVPFKTARRRLLDFQDNKSRGDARIASSSNIDGLSLQEVVVSAAQGSPESLFYMHGALENNQMSPSPSSNHILASDVENNTSGNIVSAHAETESLHDNNIDSIFAEGQTEQLVPQGRFPQRQDTASSTGTGPLRSAPAVQKPFRRVNTK